MTIVVYVGPSLAHEDAQKILPAVYRPPVKRGDLLELPDDVQTVAIIDGVLLNEAAVGHREIIALLQAGIEVIGGGSMGALRAAELEPLGMKGAGRIYEAYHAGDVDGDDEVVLAYDPFSLAPLSEPLINFRLNLEDAVKAGQISKKVADYALSELKKVYYPRRNYNKFKEILSSLLSGSEFKTFIDYWNYNYQDFKNLDAKLILENIKTNAKNLHF